MSAESAPSFDHGRVALLWDLDDPTGIVPCGFVIQYPDRVRVRIVEDGWGLREWWDEPLEGPLQPDLSRDVREPTDPLYFDRVCASLHRSFLITLMPHPDNAEVIRA